MADKDFKVKTGLDLPAPLPLTEGGTGQTTANNALNAMLPSQTTHGSKILGTDGTNVSWVNPGAAYQTSAPSNPVTGQLWVDSDETGDSLDPYIIRRKTITATAGQTVFTTDVTFTDGYEQIYYNGVLLVRTTDYTTSGGTNTVTLLQGASAGDTIEIIASTPINLVNTATTSTNTFTGVQTIKTSSNIASSGNLKVINDGAGDLIELFRNESPGVLTRRYNGTYDSPTAVLANQRSGYLIGSTYDGLTYSNNSAINMYASENQTSTARGSFITFDTTNTGTVGRSEKMRITDSGNLYIGTSDASAYGAKLAIASNSGTQASIFVWQFGVGSGQIGIPVNSSNLRIVNTYSDGTLQNGKGLDITTAGTIYSSNSYVRNVSAVNNAAFIADGAGMNSGTYNYVLNGTNNLGAACVIFVNGSTRTDDNGVNALTIRNDFANMYLGRSGATTFIYGRSDVSDQDLKENINTYSNGIDIIKSLIPKQFNFIGSERKQYGFIAQDIQSEEIVLPGGEGSPWSVDYNSIVSALVKANQELVERVEFLEAKINE